MLRIDHGTEQKSDAITVSECRAAFQPDELGLLLHAATEI
jgi:hypothetical protein